MQIQSITTLYHIEIQILMVFKTVTWNDMKVQRSRIGFNAKNASNTKDTARHFVFVEVLQCITEEVKKQAGQ